MKQKCISGWEYDMLYGRDYYSPPRDGWKAIKKQMNKRFRKEGKQELRNELNVSYIDH
jgi:hypothetical protein